MSWRSIEVDGTTWRYRVGRQHVKFRGPRTFFKSIAEVKGVGPGDVDRGKWKKTSDGMLRPSEIANYLRHEAT